MLLILLLIGVILLAILTASFFVPIRKKDVTTEVRNPKRQYVGDPETIKETLYASPVILMFFASYKGRLLSGVLGFFLFLSPWLFFEAEEGHNYYLQYKTGGTSVRTEAIGITFRGFAKITSMKDYLTASSDIADGSGSFPPTPIRFSDKVTGHQRITVRFKLPDDHEKFKAIIKEFRTEENLIRATLIPTITEVVSNSPYMFTGQGYASGEAPDYKFAVRDQIMNGTYVLEDAVDKINRSTKLEKDSLFTVGGIDGPILTKQPKTNSNGKIERISHAIKLSGITVTQVTLPDVDFVESFDLKLESQREQSAKIQEFALKQRAMEEETKFEKAKGEKDKVMEQMAQEKLAVKSIIEVQTSLAKDSIALAQSKILRDKAVVDAQTIRIKADADAYEISKKVRAGITPEKELQMRLDAQVLIETEKAKTKWPVYYMPGAGKGGGSIEALISAGMAKQLTPGN